MIAIKDLTVAFSGTDLFSDISFQLDKDDKIGLIGKNGTGKTTLLKVIIGEIQQYQGSISVPKDLNIGYLPQFLPVSNTKTVFEETFSAFDELKKINSKLDLLNEQLVGIEDYNSSEYHRIINKIEELSHQLAYNNENQLIAQTEKILKGLGFISSDFSRPTAEFSGGWRMRIEIAKLLLRQPDLLLLDEPTNHLDINSIQWFENYIKDFNGAIIVVSHDKRFLDTVTNRTIELSLGRIYDFDLPYSQYKEFKKELRQQQIQAFENQQQKIKQAERFIERFRYKPTKSAAVQSRIKMIEKMDIIEVEDEDNASINFKFPPAPRAGDIVLETKNFGKSFGNHLVFQNANISIHRGEKVAFVGKNGQGKTTFVRVLINELLDFNGSYKLGHNVSVGYYAQNQDEKLDTTKTVFDTLDDIAVGDIRPQIRKILGSFLFRDDDVDKKVSVLSGGERARLALAKLILQPYSLLILDEPTNHLDIAAKEILKKALLKYDGTVIIVSHDRDFLDGLTNVVYEFTNSNVKQYLGDINYYLEKKNFEFIDQISLNSKNQSKEIKETSESKEDYQKRKEQKRQIQKIQNQITELENNISLIEKRLLEIENLFLEPTNAGSLQLVNEYNSLKSNLDELMIKWEELNAQL